MPAIIYQVYDVNTDEGIGTLTGEELREYFTRLPQSPVANIDLVAMFNIVKRRDGEPERIRQMLRR